MKSTKNWKTSECQKDAEPSIHSMGVQTKEANCGSPESWETSQKWGEIIEAYSSQSSKEKEGWEIRD